MFVSSVVFAIREVTEFADVNTSRMIGEQSKQICTTIRLN